MKWPHSAATTACWRWPRQDRHVAGPCAALHPAAAAIGPERRSPQGLPDLPRQRRAVCAAGRPTTLAPAKAAWNTGDAKDALALLQGFDRRFRATTPCPPLMSWWPVCCCRA